MQEMKKYLMIFGMIFLIKLVKFQENISIKILFDYLFIIYYLILSFRLFILCLFILL